MRFCSRYRQELTNSGKSLSTQLTVILKWAVFSIVSMVGNCHGKPVLALAQRIISFALLVFSCIPSVSVETVKLSKKVRIIELQQFRSKHSEIKASRNWETKHLRTTQECQSISWWMMWVILCNLLDMGCVASYSTGSGHIWKTFRPRRAKRQYVVRLQISSCDDDCCCALQNTFLSTT